MRRFSLDKALDAVVERRRLHDGDIGHGVNPGSAAPAIGDPGRLALGVLRGVGVPR